MTGKRRKTRTVIGWREWIQLPDLCPVPLKAKVDTGARTSALHAVNLEIHGAGQEQKASFDLLPSQRSADGAVRIDCPVIGFRRVRSSDGRVENRPVIVTVAQAGDLAWPIEVTLASRDEMGFRMLLGRSALRRRFLIDPGRSFLATDAAAGRRQP